MFNSDNHESLLNQISQQIMRRLRPSQQEFVKQNLELQIYLERLTEKVSKEEITIPEASTNLIKQIPENKPTNLFSALSEIGKALQGVVSVFTRIQDDLAVRNNIIEEKIESITYEEVIEYFVINKPIKAKRAAMTRESDIKGNLFLTQIYLDERDQPIKLSNGKLAGRKVITRKFDTYLKESFGNQNVVIVE